jgi:hypothetical protein
MAKPLRKVVREHLFEESLAELFTNSGAADEYLAAAEWVLAFDPSIGFPAKEGSSVWLLPMQPLKDRQISLYYTFDSSTVRLLLIQATF